MTMSEKLQFCPIKSPRWIPWLFNPTSWVNRPLF